MKLNPYSAIFIVWVCLQFIMLVWFCCAVWLSNRKIEKGIFNRD